MPRLTQAVPKYRLHRQSRQAIVTINGRDHLLGPHGTKASKVQYDRLIAEWLVNDRQPFVTGGEGITVVELIARYWKYAERHYLKDGEPTGEIGALRAAFKPLRELYGSSPASEFGPIRLEAPSAAEWSRSDGQGATSTALSTESAGSFAGEFESNSSHHL